MQELQDIGAANAAGRTDKCNDWEMNVLFQPHGIDHTLYGENVTDLQLRDKSSSISCLTSLNIHNVYCFTFPTWH